MFQDKNSVFGVFLQIHVIKWKCAHLSPWHSQEQKTAHLIEMRQICCLKPVQEGDRSNHADSPNWTDFNNCLVKGAN